jgi:hypothetical protein
MTGEAPLEPRLQRTLEHLYRVDAGLPVLDFRIDRAALLEVLGAGAAGHRETLLVHRDGDETLVALFIADDVLARARAFLDGAAAGEAAPHLDEFCVATEGVSHFVYFTFAGAALERPVSQIELELQAEIDKFLVLRLSLAVAGEALLESLFDRFRLAGGLSAEAEERYLVANRAGRRYARWLERRIARGEVEQALRDARALYRKPLAAKLDHIARAA